MLSLVSDGVPSPQGTRHLESQEGSPVNEHSILILSRLFIYAMAYGTPSLLEHTDNWGAFLFFAGWCLIALIYVYLLVPETAGLTIEEIDEIFKGPWFSAHKRVKHSISIAGGNANLNEQK
jgi:hypothetical protein